MNTYGYVGGNPVGFSDPFGLKTLCQALHELLDDQQNNPFINNGPFDYSALATEPIPEGGQATGATAASNFQHSNGVWYDIQYIEVGYSLSHSYGPEIAADSFVAYSAVQAYLDSFATYGKVEISKNVSQNWNGFQAGLYGADKYDDFKDLVSEMCPEACMKNE